MRKFIVLMLLAMVSRGAAAEWVKVGGTNDGTVAYVAYVDSATMRRAGYRVKMWRLYDYETAQVLDGKRYLSSKAQQEFDCIEEKSRVHYFIQYSGNMGSGNVVYSSSGTPGNWTPIILGSVGEAKWAFACGKQ
jgi:hypothetical protein